MSIYNIRTCEYFLMVPHRSRSDMFIANIKCRKNSFPENEIFFKRTKSLKV